MSTLIGFLILAVLVLARRTSLVLPLTGPAPPLVPFRARTLAELVPVFLKWFALIRRRSENTVRGL